MTFVMAIGGEVIDECIEGIRVEVGRGLLRIVLVCPGFFGFGAQSLVGSVVRLRVYGDGDRYWRLNDGSWWSIQEMKMPCCGRGFWG